MSGVLFACIAGFACGPIAAGHAQGALPAEHERPSRTAEFTWNGKRLSAKQLDALEKGKVLVELSAVPQSSVKKATAVALIEAPPAEVFAVLTEYADFPSFMPYCRKVEVRKKEGEQSWVHFSLDFPWPIGDRHYVLVLKDCEELKDGATVFISSWTYEPGSGNINDSYGSWEVRAYDSGRSLVYYTVFTDPGGSLPNWASNAATEVAVPKVIAGLRERVGEKGRRNAAGSGEERTGPKKDGEQAERSDG